MLNLAANAANSSIARSTNGEYRRAKAIKARPFMWLGLLTTLFVTTASTQQLEDHGLCTLLHATLAKLLLAHDTSTHMFFCVRVHLDH